MDKHSPLTSDFKGIELKKKLLACLDKEAGQFSELVQVYFSKDSLSKDDKTSLLSAIIATVDHIAEAGDWQSSLFLRNTIKPLLEIKAEAVTELDRLQVHAAQKKGASVSISSNEVEVYISLFQSDGYNMNKWAMQLRSLERYILGRPVYPNEADMLGRIRLRNAGTNEGYVIVAVKKTDVQSDTFATPLKDQFDHPLIVLKENALKQGKIIAFVHQGVRYQYVDGQLIK